MEDNKSILKAQIDTLMEAQKLADPEAKARISSQILEIVKYLNLMP